MASDTQLRLIAWQVELERLTLFFLLMLTTVACIGRYVKSSVGSSRAAPSGARSGVGSVQTAVERFRFDYGTYPKTVEELVEANYLQAYPKPPDMKPPNLFKKYDYMISSTGMVTLKTVPAVPDEKDFWGWLSEQEFWKMPFLASWQLAVLVLALDITIMVFVVVALKAWTPVRCISDPQEAVVSTFSLRAAMVLLAVGVPIILIGMEAWLFFGD